MAQNYSKKEIHPSIFAAVDAANTHVMNGQTWADGTAQKAYSAYNKAWFEVHGKGFWLWLVGLLPVIATVPILRGLLEVPKPATAAVVLFALIAWIGTGIYGWEKTKKDISARELETILPALALSESQKLYLGSIIAVLNSKLLDSEQKTSWLKALYQALDNALSLEKLLESMRASLGGTSHPELIAEIQALESKVLNAKDAFARETYEQSLELAQGRLNRSHGMSAQSERIEAQLELTRQTFLQTHESLTGLSIGTQKSIHVSLDPLRANLSRVQAESESILRAIEELNQA